MTHEGAERHPRDGASPDATSGPSDPAPGARGGQRPVREAASVSAEALTYHGRPGTALPGQSAPHWSVTFDRGRASLEDHPTRPADATLRQLRRLATECDVTDHNGRQVSVDFHLVDGVDHLRSSVVFRRAPEALAARAFRIRLPRTAAPEGVPDREAVKAVAEPIASMRPPVGGSCLVISDEGIPHVVYGSTVEPTKNHGEFPAPAVTGFLADLKPAVERAVNGGEWSA